MKKLFSVLLAVAVASSLSVTAFAHHHRQAVATTQCSNSSVCMVDGVCNGTCTGTGDCANYSGCNSACNGSSSCVELGVCQGGHSSGHHRGNGHHGGCGRW